MSPNEIQETPPVKDNPQQQRTYVRKENEQELYLEHLMSMMVNVLDHGFQKG